MSELPSTIEGDAADANHMNEEMELVTPAQVAKEEAKADEEIQPDAAIAAASGNIGKQVPNLLIDPRNEVRNLYEQMHCIWVFYLCIVCYSHPHP
jgi:hypothetical protein